MNYVDELMCAERYMKIFVAGHRGMVGSAIVRGLEAKGYSDIVTQTRSQLDLLDQRAVTEFLECNPQGIDAPVKVILRRLEDFKPMGADAWPRSPKGLVDALRRAAPALQKMGHGPLRATALVR